jgi:hypothetical protein
MREICSSLRRPDCSAVPEMRTAEKNKRWNRRDGSSNCFSHDADPKSIQIAVPIRGRRKCMLYAHSSRYHDGADLLTAPAIRDQSYTYSKACS